MAAKVSFILGGMGMKPDKNFKNVSPGRFNKASRCLKPILGNQTRINDLDMLNTTLVTKKQGCDPIV